MKILHVLAQLPGKTGSGVYFSNMIQGFKTYEHEQKALFAVQDEYDWNVCRSTQYYVQKLYNRCFSRLYDTCNFRYGNGISCNETLVPYFYSFTCCYVNRITDVVSTIQKKRKKFICCRSNNR